MKKRRLILTAAIALMTVLTAVLAGCESEPLSESFAVIFNSNGGSAIESQMVVKGTKLTEPATPARVGYAFGGWFTDDGTFENRITFPYTVTSYINLYAKWATDVCIVTFDSNGGSEIAPQTVARGKMATEPAVPTKEGYTFGGWFTGNDPLDGVVTFPYTVTADVTLYVRWYVNEIRTAADLEAIRNCLSGSYTLMSNISLTEYSNWQPIGTEAAPFTGKFDGNGHRITDLTINKPKDGNAGLFGLIKSGCVSDLEVEIGIGGINGGSWSGGIAGAAVGNGIIANCCSTGNISSTGISGGIVGSLGNSMITDCYSTVNIIASSSYSHSGGIAGYVDNGSTIANCYTTGNITSGYESGGIAGHVVYGTTITNCAAINSVVSATGSSTYAGRITGSNSGTVSNNVALNTMSITGNTSYGSNGVDKTIGELQIQTTYSDTPVGDGEGGLGWKFGNDDDNPWKMLVGGGYPVLYWQ